MQTLLFIKFDRRTSKSLHTQPHTVSVCIPCWEHQRWGHSAGALRLCVCRHFVQRCAVPGVEPCPWCHSWWAMPLRFRGLAGGLLPAEWSHPERGDNEWKRWWHDRKGRGGREVKERSERERNQTKYAVAWLFFFGMKTIFIYLHKTCVFHYHRCKMPKYPWYITWNLEMGLVFLRK